MARLHPLSYQLSVVSCTVPLSPVRTSTATGIISLSRRVHLSVASERKQSDYRAQHVLQHAQKRRRRRRREVYSKETILHWTTSGCHSHTGRHSAFNHCTGSHENSRFVQTGWYQRNLMREKEGVPREHLHPAPGRRKSRKLIRSRGRERARPPQPSQPPL